MLFKPSTPAQSLIYPILLFSPALSTMVFPSSPILPYSRQSSAQGFLQNVGLPFSTYELQSCLSSYSFQTALCLSKSLTFNFRHSENTDRGRSRLPFPSVTLQSPSLSLKTRHTSKIQQREFRNSYCRNGATQTKPQ